MKGEITVRVRLTTGQSGVRVHSASPLTVSTGGLNRRVSPGGVVELSHNNGEVQIKIDGAEWQKAWDTVVINGAGLLNVGARMYRGGIRAFVLTDTGMVVVNQLSLEDYLYGVIVAEIGPINKNTYEAVKAQAVAARSFTLARLGKRKGLGYDLYDSFLRDQEYRGAGAEMSLANQAVDETRGEVLYYQDAPAMVLYHACCGGITADGSEEFLVSVIDAPGHHRGATPFCVRSKHHTWVVTVKKDSLERVLGRLKFSGAKVRVRSLRLEKDRTGKRVKKLHFVTDRGTVTVGGSEFRMALGLKSTYFDMSLGSGTARFTGRGWGHGVGLCQDGAIAMAERGYSYRQILTHYYPRLRLKRAY